MYHIKAFNLSECTFTNNTAWMGGALYILTTLGGMMKSCLFESNSATAGGAVFACDKRRMTKMVLMWNCTLRQNVATVIAGAVLINDTSFKLSHTDVSSNISPVGSAIFCEGKVSTLHFVIGKITNNTFMKKVNDLSSGSAIYIADAMHVKISGVTFYKNHVGGAIMLGNTRAEIHNCSFYRNVGVSGGAISVFHESGELILINTTFVENRASVGAVMSLSNRNTLIQSCQFKNNKAEATTTPADIVSSGQNVIILRLFQNTFFEPDESNRPPGQTVLMLNNQAATVYFWKLLYHFYSNKTLPIDKHVLHNSSMPTTVTYTEETHFTEIFSPFAAGK